MMKPLNVNGAYEPICHREVIRAWSPGWGVAKIEARMLFLGQLMTIFDSDDPAKMLDLAEQFDDVAAELRGFAERRKAIKAEEEAEAGQADTIESQSREITGQYRRDAAPAQEVA